MKERKSISYLIETELEKATVILAAKAITEKLQQMAESLAKLDANEIMPLGDAMKDIFGSEQATAFESAVTNQVRELVEKMRETKAAIDEKISALENGSNITDISNADNTDDLFASDDTADVADDSEDELNIDTEKSDDAQEPNMDDVFEPTEDDRNSKGRMQKESIDTKVAREFSSYLREGYSVKDSAQKISDTYALTTTSLSKILAKVKKK